MYQQIEANKRKSIALLFGFLVLYAAIGFAASLQFGSVAFVVTGAVAITMLLINLFGGDDMAVAVGGGQQIKSKDEAPVLWRQVENLSIAAGVEMPRVYISPNDSPNAFAAGRSPKQAIVCVTSGLLERLDEQELEGVLAHEMSHIRNYDVRLMTFAAVLAGSIALLAEFLLHSAFFGGRDRDRDSNPFGIIIMILVAVLAPIAALVIQMAISRRREYVADAAAVELTRYPQGLASALATISGNMTPSRFDNKAIAHMMIAPPLSAHGHASKLFATHPPSEDRIARLTEMAAGIQHTRKAPVGLPAQVSP